MEGGDLKRMPSRTVSLRRQQSGRKLERSTSILEPERYLRSSSLLLKSEEATVAPPTLSEPLVLGFEGLAPLDVKPDDPLPLDPAGAVHGVLENGMRYYVQQNAKPRDRAALALAVSVGSVLEEDGEQGVAHIVEHLAFSATKDYKNHDLVHFLETIGSKFGPCQNAYTSVDETVYEILVPVDNPEILPKALHVLAEFSTEIRASDEDLEKERGPVLEEWRRGRNASGRLALSYWRVLLEGSKYADRWTIGEEQVIKTVPGHRVRDFYHHWYQPENMAVVAVGDFSNVEAVVKLIKLQFAAKQGHVQDTSNRPLTIPTFPVPPHDEPRFSCFVDTEADESVVNIACKAPCPRRLAVKDVRLSLARWMFFSALNYRFHRISKQTDRPFFSCRTNTEDLVRPAMIYYAEASCPEGGTIQALEQMLIEFARVRLYGFSEREISVARAALIANIKSTYLQRDQLQSTHWRDEYVQHFLLGNALLPIEYKTQLQKTLGAEITAAEVSKIAESFNTTCSCIIKTVEPKVTANEGELKAIVAKVTALEREGAISTWNEQDIPDVIVKELPTRGTVVETKDCPEFEATEITLSNGMKVCYKCTDFLDDQILMYGFAYGGLSEVDESDHYTCEMASAFADEIGKFGHKPSILAEMIADKLVSGDVALGYYTRSFEAESTTADLETALQLLHQLFVTKVEYTEEVVKMVLQMYSENIKALDRDPSTEYGKRVISINYGDSPFYTYNWTEETLAKVDPKKSCQYFNSCYTDPSTFTVMMVGAIRTEKALPLIQQYLGGIPKPAKPVLEYKRGSLTVVPLNPASHIIREEVRRDMVEAQAKVYLSFPINLQGLNVAIDEAYTNFMCKFLETKIYQALRFKHGKIYGAGVWAHVGLGSNPFVGEKSLGHVAVSFSCDPDMAWKLVDLTLEEIKKLQEEEPPINDDVETVLEIEQREYENCQEDNGYWIGRLRQAYQSRNYTGDLGRSFKAQDELRDTVRAQMNTKTMQEVLRHILPLPCTCDYKVVVLLPTDAQVQ